MEKYFKIEIRMAEGVIEYKEGYQLVDKFYWGDGFIRIKDNTISGAVGLDYINGKINDEIVELTLYTEDEYHIMSINVEKLKILPKKVFFNKKYSQLNYIINTKNNNILKW